MAAVELRHVSIAYGAQRVVDDLSLRVEAGELLALLGPSGCGKSTLLHAIAGLQPLSAGSVWLHGVDCTNAEPAARRIGMVFQSYALYPSMTVAENLGFGLKVAGVARAEVQQRVRRAADLLQIGELLQRRPAQLSGGQRQRVAIGRALVREAEVFLLDEPLSNLDAALRTELRRELKQLHARLGNTMIFVTHDQAEAMTLGTRMAVLASGRLQQLGSPHEVYSQPANRFVARFVGSPACNLLPGTVRRDDGRPVFHAGGLQLGLGDCPAAGALADGAEVELGVRPEDLVPDDAAALRATVTLVEAQGSHSTLWLEAGGQSLAMLVAGNSALAVGSSLGIAVDGRRMSLYDRASGLRLGAGAKS